MSKNIKSEPVNEQSEAELKTTQPVPKRSFVPNLAAKRADKDTTTKPEATTSTTKQPRRPFVPNLSNRGRGARSSNLIQSHSIFEAGPAESTKRFGNNDATESYSKVVGPSTQTNKIKSESENYIKIEHSLLIEESKQDLDNNNAYVNLKFESKEQFNDADIDIKRNETDSRLANVFTQQEEKLILFQMPENLNLNELKDGSIGKLRVYKSGRVELCLNDEKYLNVSLSVAGSFLQEAVGLELTAEQTDVINNKMTNLGQIETKLVCSPLLS